MDADILLKIFRLPGLPTPAQIIKVNLSEFFLSSKTAGIILSCVYAPSGLDVKFLTQCTKSLTR